MSSRSPDFVNLRWSTRDIYGRDYRQQRRLTRRLARRIQGLGAVEPYNALRRRVTR